MCAGKTLANKIWGFLRRPARRGQPTATFVKNHRSTENDSTLSKTFQAPSIRYYRANGGRRCFTFVPQQEHITSHESNQTVQMPGEQTHPREAHLLLRFAVPFSAPWEPEIRSVRFDHQSMQRNLLHLAVDVRIRAADVSISPSSRPKFMRSMCIVLFGEGASIADTTRREKLK